MDLGGTRRSRPARCRALAVRGTRSRGSRRNRRSRPRGDGVRASSRTRLPARWRPASAAAGLAPTPSAGGRGPARAGPGSSSAASAPRPPSSRSAPVTFWYSTFSFSSSVSSGTFSCRKSSASCAGDPLEDAVPIGREGLAVRVGEELPLDAVPPRPAVGGDVLRRTRGTPSPCAASSVCMSWRRSADALLSTHAASSLQSRIQCSSSSGDAGLRDSSLTRWDSTSGQRPRLAAAATNRRGNSAAAAGICVMGSSRRRPAPRGIGPGVLRGPGRPSQAKHRRGLRKRQDRRRAAGAGLRLRLLVHRHDPDVPETHRVPVILEVQRALLRVVLQHGRIVDSDAVVPDAIAGLPVGLPSFCSTRYSMS